MKPRIKKIGPVFWLCASEEGIAAGDSPLSAYLSWLKNPQHLFQ